MLSRITQLVLELGKHRVTTHDIVLFVGVVLGALFLALEFDVFRDQGVAPAEEQRLELRELLAFGSFLVLGLLSLVWWRGGRFKKELMRRIAAEQTAHASSRQDSLTGLPNRRRFTERSAEVLNRALSEGSQCAVLFIDLDGFKPVNDTLGHALGDALLVEIADRLRSCVSDPANVARLGGDEFAVLIEYRDGNDASALVARRILREIQRPMIIDGKSIAVGATVGVAIGPDNGAHAEDLIHAADLAMYAGKKEGRGTISVFKAA